METEIFGHLVTTAISTACRNRALAVLVLSWQGGRPALPYRSQQQYAEFKQQALHDATKALGVTPLLLEPPPAGHWYPARVRKPMGEGITAATT